MGRPRRGGEVGDGLLQIDAQASGGIDVHTFQQHVFETGLGERGADVAAPIWISGWATGA